MRELRTMISSPASVVLILLLLGRTDGDSVDQTKGQVTLMEGASLILKCTYDATFTIYPFWYIQFPKENLRLLLKDTNEKEQKESSNGFHAKHGKDDKSFDLKKDAVTQGDSAIYYCAVRTTGSNQLKFGPGTRLTVMLNVTNPQPRMYRLKKPQVNDLSICLFTDFGNDEVNMTGIRNIMRAPSVVDVKRLESKSLGIVAWDNSLDWDCQAQASEAIYSLSNSSGKVCNAKVVTENFSSDPYLNSRNLAMIFLRVVFVKTMGFNLLMTLKLWSS